MSDAPISREKSPAAPVEVNSLARQYAGMVQRTAADDVLIPTERPNQPLNLNDFTAYPADSWEAKTYLAMLKSMVRVDGGQLIHQPPGAPANNPFSSFGSGFIIDREGTVATDDHVIRDVKPDGIKVFVNNAWHTARVVEQTPANDGAKLQVVPNYPNETFTPVKLAAPGAHLNGHHLMFGFPARNNTLFMAVDDAKYPTSKLMPLSDIDQFYANTGYIPAPGEDPNRQVIQSDMIAGKGFSGGAYVNLNGEVEGRDIASDLMIGGYSYANPIDDLHPGQRRVERLAPALPRPVAPRPTAIQPHPDVTAPLGAAAGVANGFKF